MTHEDKQPAERLPIHPTSDDHGKAVKPVLPASPGPTAAQKPIRDLKPGEPPPESSAGS